MRAPATGFRGRGSSLYRPRNWPARFRFEPGPAFLVVLLATTQHSFAVLGRRCPATAALRPDAMPPVGGVDSCGTVC